MKESVLRGSQQVAVFFDRDGTIITNRDYNNDPEGIVWYPQTFIAMRALLAHGFRIFIISNQSAVARGYCSCSEVEYFNSCLDKKLRLEKVYVSGFYYSPFHPKGTVPPFNVDHVSRKPAPGMLLEAAAEYDIDLKTSVMVGDSAVDLGAGRNAGCKTVLVLTGHGRKTLSEIERGNVMAPDAVIPHIGFLPDLIGRCVW